jgi:hypothetical protein
MGVCHLRGDHVSEGQEVFIARLPLSLPCPVPVMPGTGETTEPCHACGGGRVTVTLPMGPDDTMVKTECEVCGGTGQAPVPISLRTEKCHVDAWWMLGGQVTCDIHLKLACQYLGLDYNSMLIEAAGVYGETAAGVLAGCQMDESIPWAERHRYPQDV